MSQDIVRPAGVDRSSLGRRPALASDEDARAIGRRSAHKILAGFTDAGISAPETSAMIEGIVEAEVHSSLDQRREGEVIIRLTYAQAVQAVTAIREADGPERLSEERETLEELRQIFFLALGLI